MSDSEASPASDGGTHSESEHSQHESDPDQHNDLDDEDADQQDEQEVEESTAKVRKPRLSWVTLKQWNLQEQDKEEVMSELTDMARAELVPFVPQGFLKSDPPNSLAHWRQKSSVSEKRNGVQ